MNNLIIKNGLVILLPGCPYQRKNGLSLHYISDFTFCCTQVKKGNKKLATIHTKLFEKHWIKEFQRQVLLLL